MGERFKIIERLDKGGMAEVFRGVSESLRGFKKSVAIKRILPNLAQNDKFVSMFLDEARLSLYLQHANIVQVFDIGQSADTYFLVMEFVDGCNLKAVIEHLKAQGRPMPIAEAVYMMIESCKGLSYAHSLEHPETMEPLHIVHRDISPPNLLLSKNGEVKLVDFGLAKANSQIETTDPGVVKGKFSYLSPEAAHGQHVDHRADVFAIGIMLYEMFTGRRLFWGDTDWETVQQVREARVPSMQAQNPKVDSDLERIVRKALARNPAERYQEAYDLGDALSQYLYSRGMKVSARSIAQLVRDVREAKVKMTGGHSIVDAVVQEEMQALTSLLEDDADPGDSGQLAEAADAPAGGDFIDTSNWASDIFADEPSAPSHPEPEPAIIIDEAPMLDLDISAPSQARAQAAPPRPPAPPAPPPRRSAAKPPPVPPPIPPPRKK